MKRVMSAASAAAMGCALCAAMAPEASAQMSMGNTSGKLLLTGGVSQVEGSAGGGLTPWATIGGYGTNDQIGATGYYTYVDTNDFSLESYGALLAVNDRFEFSI